MINIELIFIFWPDGQTFNQSAALISYDQLRVLRDKNINVRLELSL